MLYIELGKIVGVWGVKGGLKCYSYTRQRHDLCEYTRWVLLPLDKRAASQKQREEQTLEQRIQFAQKNGFSLKQYNVSGCKLQGRGIVAFLDGIDDRDKAESLLYHSILIKESDLSALPKGEYYWNQIIGLRVENQNGNIGQIKTMIETGANDVMVIEKNQGGEILVPYVFNQVIKHVDLSKGVMLVDWDPNCLD